MLVIVIVKMGEDGHCVKFNLMQLPRPETTHPRIITCDDDPEINKGLIDSVGTVQGIECLGVGEFLLVPQFQQVVYLGEVVRCYLHVYNNSRNTVNGVSFNVNVHYNQNTVHNFNRPSFTLGLNDNMGHIIEFKAKALYPHIVTIEVNYSNLSDKVVSYRNQFRFDVLPLLEIKPKFREMDLGDILVQIDIKNKSPDIIWLDKVCPKFNKHVEVESFNDELNISVLKPNDCLLYLYSLKRVQLNELTRNLLEYIEVCWSTQRTNKGILRIDCIKNIDVNENDLKISYELTKSEVRLEEPFDFKCRVVNMTNRLLNLTLKLMPSDRMLWSGISDRYVGDLIPGDELQLDLTVFPVEFGFQTIPPICLNDSHLGQTFEFKDRSVVFVT